MVLKQNKIVKFILLGSTFLVLTLGISFAWFTANQSSNRQEMVTVGTLQITYEQGNKVYASNLKPATSLQVLQAYNEGGCIFTDDNIENVVGEQICSYNTFTIRNTGSLAAITDINLSNIISSYGSNMLKYAFFEVPPMILPSNNLDGVVSLAENITIASGDVKTYTILIWLDESATNSEQNKKYEANIEANAVQTNQVDNNLDTSGANAPSLVDGMIPIYFDETDDLWKKADSTNTNSSYKWYNYDEKMWANAVLVSASSREDYMNAPTGNIIAENDILAYYVWIPRYKYKLFNLDYKLPLSEAPHVSLIDVSFENGLSSSGTVSCNINDLGEEFCESTISGSNVLSTNDYYTHPAFTFGFQELSGIWVGKFETGSNLNINCHLEENESICNEVVDPVSKPDLFSLVYQDVSKQFLSSLRIKSTTYMTSTAVSSSSTDSHMMKNTEWGAVAYFKQSVYGLGMTNVASNSCNQFKTGYGSITGGNSCTVSNNYQSESGRTASTTGTIYGVYDMSGCSSEYTMGNLAYDDTYMISGDDEIFNSGFSGYIYDLELDDYRLFSGVTYPDNKYYDKYVYNDDSSNFDGSHLGDATGETNDWDSSNASMPDDVSPWFVRGSQVDFSPGILSFVPETGVADLFSFRLILVNK